MTPMMPNPFISNSAVIQPPTAEYPAVAPSTGKVDATAGLDDLERLLRFAGRRPHRRLVLPRFAPDFQGMWEAMHDPDAPRAPRPSLDPVWEDASPIFLRQA